MIFDSHAHYDDRKFNADRDELLSSMHENGVDYIVNSGESLKASKAGVELGKKYDFIYSASGIHPSNTDTMDENVLKEIKKIALMPKVVAIGEIGLDYHYDNTDKPTQKYWFSRQLELAKELDMPVIIHSRDAAQECFDMIKKSGVRKGIIHCYSGSAEMAMEYVKMGFYIGIGGVLTYSNARKTVDVAEEVPLNRIVLETDCPYLAPVPNRGKRNDSTMIKYVAEKLAEIKNISVEQVYFVTSQNAKDVFELKV